jgi:hypothetical protein
MHHGLRLFLFSIVPVPVPACSWLYVCCIISHLVFSFDFGQLLGICKLPIRELPRSRRGLRTSNLVVTCDGNEFGLKMGYTAEGD